ncbi:MAG: elongation factor P maturation arginine rhamnosyltransferase EarP [Hydrogenophilus sp.]|nr:elongation factor P maturation arginine rhamnosyltransferase EarP [Hydrogenophilus sp.]
MPSPPLPPLALFTAVVDHWGDIGVAWRLIRRLLSLGYPILWWSDNLSQTRAFLAASPLPTLFPGALTLRPWRHDSPTATDRPLLARAAALIDLFATGLTDPWLSAALDNRSTPLSWILLAPLTPGPWAADLHGRPSPHPRLPIDGRWCVPGFVPGSAGLIREPDRLPSPLDFASPLSSPLPEALLSHVCSYPRRILLFTYADAPLLPLFTALLDNPTPTLLLVSGRETRLALVQTFAALRSFPPLPSLFSPSPDPAPSPSSLLPLPLPGTPHALLLLPWLSADAFDALLALSDFNWVRGEDSFVRAQWAARPFCWSPYRRPDGEHRHFADAFARLSQLPWAVADTDSRVADPRYWQAILQKLPQLRPAAAAWRDSLLCLPELTQILLALIAADRQRLAPSPPPSSAKR